MGRLHFKMANVAPDDDDSWLYGDGASAAPEKEREPEEVEEKKDIKNIKREPIERDEKPVLSAAGVAANLKDKEAGEVSGGEEANKDNSDSDSDSDEDDIQVTIGDITTKAAYTGQRRYGHQVAAAKSKGVDVDAVGEINGVPTHEFDIETLSSNDKPWNKPGADITDYF